MRGPPARRGVAPGSLPEIPAPSPTAYDLVVCLPETPILDASRGEVDITAYGFRARWLPIIIGGDRQPPETHSG
jgi:hypothetical protein